MASSPPALVTLDDTDPAIVYQPESLWRHVNRQDSVINGTYAAGYTNATATLVFNGTCPGHLRLSRKLSSPRRVCAHHTGTQMYVFGVSLPPDNDVPTRAPIVTFIMDGETEPSQIPPSDDKVRYAWQWFSWPTLAPGEHTLGMHVDRGYNDSETEWPWVLDYVQYAPLSSNSSDATPSITAGASRGRAAVGPIVGGVVGGIAGLTLLALAAFLLFVKRRRRGEGSPVSNKEVDLLEQGARKSHRPHPPVC